MTYSFPFLLTILQSALRFLMDARTFMTSCLYFYWCHAVGFASCHNNILFVSEYNPSSCQIVGTHLHPHLISRQNPYVIHPHFPRNGGQDLMPIFQLHFEHSIGQGFQNDTILFNECLFRHTVFGSAKIGFLCRNTKTSTRKINFNEIIGYFLPNPSSGPPL